MLAAQKSVKEDLKLSDDQEKSIASLAEKLHEGFRGMRNASPEDRQKFQEQVAANEKSLADTLKPEQLKRLKQIALQQQGSFAIGRGEVAEELKLTADQKEKLKALQDDAQGKMRQAMSGGNREEARGKIADLRKATNEKMLELLTDEQKTKWKELTGEPFTGEIRFGDGPRRPGGDAPKPPARNPAPDKAPGGNAPPAPPTTT